MWAIDVFPGNHAIHRVGPTTNGPHLEDVVTNYDTIPYPIL